MRQSYRFIFALAAFAAGALALAPAALAGTYNLEIDRGTIDVTEDNRDAMTINGTVPGPVLRFKEGEELTINVANRMDVDTSIHWHGLILPYKQDGVPGISFPGIKAGETFTYRFPAQQAGTYWYHSHSGLQEQAGIYGAIIIEPEKREPFRFDKEYVVVLSDWHQTDKPEAIITNLKRMSDYYNYQQRTLGTFIDDAKKMGIGAALSDRLDWGSMRMLPSDIADVSGYVFLMNGQNPEQNWTGLFKPGERIRLRFINAAAMTYFDVRIPGLKMTVVQADGNNVRPVPVDEFRIAVAETYDVIVRPTEDKAYTIFAESMARTGHARGTLTPEMGRTADVPDARPKQFLTMADMGMAHGDMAGMDHGAMKMDQGKMDHGSMMKGMDHGAMKMPGGDHKMPDGTMMKGMDHSQMGHGTMKGMDHGAMKMPEGDHKMPDGTMMKGMDHGKMGHGAMTSKPKDDPFYAPGSGLMPKAANGGKFLSYADLKAFRPLYPERESTRVIEVRLTGNMERYIWSINDVKYSDAEPIKLKFGERVRFKFINETMMTHPMHLHGMWQILDNGSGKDNPAKHTISIAPGTTVEADIEADAEGQWAFHCHLMYHMASGMFRKVVVERETAEIAR
ncbi:MAG: copper resistance system multicopper oxidase [Rhodospirillales bacterium]